MPWLTLRRLCSPPKANNSGVNKRQITDLVDQSIQINTHCFVVTADNRYILVCGFWDKSFRVYSTETGRFYLTIKTCWSFCPLILYFLFSSQMCVVGFLLLIKNAICDFVIFKCGSSLVHLYLNFDLIILGKICIVVSVQRFKLVTLLV